MPAPFFEKPVCRVTTHVGNRNRKFPAIEVNEEDEAHLIYFRLSKAGYGSVNEIENWDVKKVLHALVYESFIDDYEHAYLELNKEG